MGLKDKMIKIAREIEESRPQFTPLELNEGNVQAIFYRCLATKDSKELTGPILFSQKNGYPKDSEPVMFDKAKILKNEKTLIIFLDSCKMSEVQSMSLPPVLLQ